MVTRTLRFSVVDSYVKRVDDEFCSHVPRHRPTNDAADKYVEDDREKQETGQCWNAGDICNPELIGGRGGELSVDQVGRRSRFLVADRRLERLPRAGALNVALVYQSRYPLIAAEDLLIAKIGLRGRPNISNDARSQVTIRLPSTIFAGHRFEGTRLSHPRKLLGETSKTRHCVVTGQTAGCTFTNSKTLGGIESLSRANQAAAFPKISRSILSCRFSLRSLAGSSCSVVVKPPLPRPAFRCESSVPRELKLRREVMYAVRPPPDRASSTICCRNSAR